MSSGCQKLCVAREAISGAGAAAKKERMSLRSIRAAAVRPLFSVLLDRPGFSQA
jgi:hypothetical protein